MGTCVVVGGVDGGGRGWGHTWEELILPIHIVQY